MLMTFKVGLTLGLSIIGSIGAQNIFLIKQGVKSEHPYLCAFMCFLCDFILIILGVAGVGALLLKMPILKSVILAAGVIFLGVCGVKSIRHAFNYQAVLKGIEMIRANNESVVSISRLVILTLSFSLLNPQAILDTMVIIGGNANHYVSYPKYLFVAGTIAASFVWFFGLATATHYFSDRLMTVKFWRGLEFFSGSIMIVFAANFLFTMLNFNFLAYLSA